MKQGLENMDQEIKDKLVHLVCMLNEIDTLKSRVKQHDTGHIKTTINVLQERVTELKHQLLET